MVYYLFIFSLALLSSVSWAGSDQIMVVWIDESQTVATYLLCNVSTATCEKVRPSNNISIHLINKIGVGGNSVGYSACPQTPKCCRFWVRVPLLSADYWALCPRCGPTCLQTLSNVVLYMEPSISQFPDRDKGLRFNQQINQL